jgi:hypothetical protein
MKGPAQRPLVIPEPQPRVDSEFFEAIMKDVEAGRVLTVRDVAARLNVSVDKARDEIKSQLGHFKVGSDFRLPECVFRRMMMRHVGFLN